MTIAAERSHWRPFASLIATIENVNRGKGKPRVKPEDRMPIAEPKRSTGIRLTRDNLEAALRPLATNR